MSVLISQEVNCNNWSKPEDAETNKRKRQADNNKTTRKYAY